MEGRAGQAEARQRRGLGPVRRVDAEGALDAAVVEDEDEELVLCLRVRPDHDDDAVAERLRELDLAERRRTHDPPSAQDARAGELGNARLRGSRAADDELPPVRQAAA